MVQRCLFLFSSICSRQKDVGRKGGEEQVRGPGAPLAASGGGDGLVRAARPPLPPPPPSHHPHPHPMSVFLLTLHMLAGSHTLGSCPIHAAALGPAPTHPVQAVDTAVQSWQWQLWAPRPGPCRQGPAGSWTSSQLFNPPNLLKNSKQRSFLGHVSARLLWHWATYTASWFSLSALPVCFHQVPGKNLTVFLRGYFPPTAPEHRLTLSPAAGDRPPSWPVA